MCRAITTTNCQGSGHDEADGTPEPSPEDDGDEQGKFGNAHALPIKQRFQNHVGDQFQDHDEADYHRGMLPIGEDGES